MSKILLVEDDEVFGSLLENYLKMSGYSVDWKKDGAQGYSSFCQYTYNLCILDVMMPNMDGFTLGKKIKEINNQVPFLFLTARGTKEDILQGYKLGASDYLTKPFDVEILLHKLSLLLNSTSNPIASVEHQIGAFIFNSKFRTLSTKESTKRLSPKESALLEMLVQKNGDLLERKVALEKIWKEDTYFTKRSMDVYVAKLRKYLSEDESIKIETIPNLGFILH